MLKVKNVTKYYDKIKAVEDLSFEVKEGEIFGLLGVNGAGKTTTFRMIMGLLDKDEGEITFNGKPIDYNVTDKIGFLTEDRSLLSKYTVLEQAYFYGSLKGMNKKEIEKNLNYFLRRLKIPEFKERKIKELSKGNQQKVQFIMAILNKPKLLILDEPFTGLDPINVELFKEVILEMKENNTVIIFSTHRMDHVEYFCEKLVILVEGRSVLSGKLSEIKKDYRKKNIKVIGEFDKEKVKKIRGVNKIIEAPNETIIKIKDDTVAPKVFKEISKSKDISKYVVESASLEEIFIDKVGEEYAK